MHKRFTALFGCLVVLWCLLMPLHAAADSLSFERARMKDILNTVSKDIEKNFYDPHMKGVDWKAQVAEARAKIDKATNVGQMITAIFVVADSLKDSHTVFLPPQRAVTYKFGFDAMAVGDRVLVTKLDKGGAAEKAGLQLGDHILTVNGYNATRQDFDLMMLFFRALRPVTSMDAEVERSGQITKVHIEAKEIMEPLVTDMTKMDTIWQLIREAENDEDHYHYRIAKDDIGYVQLPSFMESGDFVSNLLNKVKNSKAIIIDLRSNPGGAIDTLRSFAGHFTNKDTVIADIEGRKGPEPMKVKPVRPLLDAAIFVLVDSRSASSAEIFARYAQLQYGATVIGDVSSGRCEAARLYPEKIGTDTIVPFGVEVTIGQVKFPNGDNLEGRGVKPDVQCLPTVEDIKGKRDTCLGVAEKLARKKLGLPEPKPEVIVTSKDKASM